jgi:hypothetical protein
MNTNNVECQSLGYLTSVRLTREARNQQMRGLVLVRQEEAWFRLEIHGMW